MEGFFTGWVYLVSKGSDVWVSLLFHRFRAFSSIILLTIFFISLLFSLYQFPLLSYRLWGLISLWWVLSCLGGFVYAHCFLLVSSYCSMYFLSLCSILHTFSYLIKWNSLSDHQLFQESSNSRKLYDDPIEKGYVCITPQEPRVAWRKDFQKEWTEIYPALRICEHPQVCPAACI